LSIAQTIAQAHGSSIEVESTPGAGSCFHLALRGTNPANGS
jgi:signal transduction histidine kinase